MNKLVLWSAIRGETRWFGVFEIMLDLLVIKTLPPWLRHRGNCGRQKTSRIVTVILYLKLSSQVYTQ